MKRSESRILTTHTGSLPRSPELQELLRSRLDPKEGEVEEYSAGVDEGVLFSCRSIDRKLPASSLGRKELR